MNKNRNNIILLVFSQAALLGAAFAQYLWGDPFHIGSPTTHMIILFSFGASIIINIFVAGRMVRLYGKEALLETRKAMAESFTTLAESTRAQNEDFVNHFREISRLIQGGRMEELGVYLEGISGKIAVLNDVLKVDNPIIGALLRAKAAEADIRRARLDIDITASLAGVESNALDISRILGNLIDNALDAVAALEESERTVTVDIHKSGPLLKIEVGNRGKIDGHFAKMIFDQGYTTKGPGHSGLGLYIVKSLSEKIGGTVFLMDNEPGIIRFVVNIPGSVMAVPPKGFDPVR